MSVLFDRFVGVTIGAEWAVLERLGEGDVGARYRAKHWPTDATGILELIAGRGRLRPEVRASAREAVAPPRGGPVAGLLLPCAGGEDEEQDALWVAWPAPPDARPFERLVELTAKLATESAIRLGRGLAEVLAGHHAAGVVHGALTPRSVLAAQDGALVLVIQRCLAGVRASPALTAPQSSSLPNLIGYLSPEALDAPSRDPRSDVYAAAVVLYALLAGRPPFVHGDGLRLIRSVLQDPPPPVRAFRPDVPEAVDAALARALAKDPRARPDAAAFAASLRPAR